MLSKRTLRTFRVKRKRHLDWQKSFGKRVREIRLSKGLTQEKLSFLADIELSTLNRIELGKSATSLPNIFSLADALKVHPKVFFEF